MSGNKKPPRIGVTAGFDHPHPERENYRGKTLLYVEQSMAHWIMTHGALPVLLPPATAPFRPEDLVNQIDGILFSGGDDVWPGHYGEEPLQPEWSGDAVRDRYELDLFRACMRADKPVLGICRGAQLINVALGGTLYQDIKTQQPDALAHTDRALFDSLRHEIELAEGSRLRQLYGRTTGRIISVHHQAIKNLAPDLRVEARSVPDGILEAVRYAPGPGARAIYIFAVQWHPEFQASGDAELLPREPIFDDFLAAVRARIAEENRT